jgi:hypothetical protein
MLEISTDTNYTDKVVVEVTCSSHGGKPFFTYPFVRTRRRRRQQRSNSAINGAKGVGYFARFDTRINAPSSLLFDSLVAAIESDLPTAPSLVTVTHGSSTFGGKSYT